LARHVVHARGPRAWARAAEPRGMRAREGREVAVAREPGGAREQGKGKREGRRREGGKKKGRRKGKSKRGEKKWEKKKGKKRRRRKKRKWGKEKERKENGKMTRAGGIRGGDHGRSATRATLARCARRTRSGAAAGFSVGSGIRVSTKTF
jgi:hypothetical protein